MPTRIEWVRNPDGSPGETWNPVVGCSPCSPGCRGCYAARLAGTRLWKNPAYAGLTKEVGGHWTGETRLLEDRLDKPLHWRAPRGVFVCDMGDLFHESVQDKWIDKVLLIAQRARRHTYMLLTKRPERMQKYFTAYGEPLPNLRLGVTVCNQEEADEKIPFLLQTPAAYRFVSYEPALGPVDWGIPLSAQGATAMAFFTEKAWKRKISWLIAGGENGPGARPARRPQARGPAAGRAGSRGDAEGGSEMSGRKADGFFWMSAGNYCVVILDRSRQPGLRRNPPSTTPYHKHFSSDNLSDLRRAVRRAGYILPKRTRRMCELAPRSERGIDF